MWLCGTSLLITTSSTRRSAVHFAPGSAAHAPCRLSARLRQPAPALPRCQDERANTGPVTREVVVLLALVVAPACPGRCPAEGNCATTEKERHRALRARGRRMPRR